MALQITSLWMLEDYLAEGGEVLLTRTQRQPPAHEIWTEALSGALISPVVIQEAIVAGMLVILSDGLFGGDGQLFGSPSHAAELVW